MLEPNSEASRRDVLESIGAVGVAGLAGTGTASALQDTEDINRFDSTLDDEASRRTVRIETTDSVEYTFSVTGLLSATNTPSAAVNGGTASARLSGGAHEFSFTGEFTEFSLDGDADVYVDGEPFDVAAFPRQTVEIVPDGSVTYDLSASGSVVVENGTAEQPNARRAIGQTSRTHVLSYAGELTYFDLEGDATVRKNGSEVNSDAVLPSTHPHELTVATDTADACQLTVSQGIDTPSHTKVAPGEAVTLDSGATARFTGEIRSVEHPSGGQVVSKRAENTITLRAPTAGTATFSIETTDGIVADHEAYDRLDLTLSDGSEETVVPFGDVQRIKINDIVVEVDVDAFPEAERSAKRQLAARVERTPAYSRLSGLTSGRIRHDVAGIAAERAVGSAGANTTESVEFDLAQPQSGDKAVISIRQSGSEVEHAAVRREEIEDGRTTSVTSAILPIGAAHEGVRRETAEISGEYPSTTEQTADSPSTTRTHDAELFADSLSPSSLENADLGKYEDQLTESQLRDQGFIGFLNDIRDLLEYIGAPVVSAAQQIYDIVKGRLDQLAVTGLDLLVESPFILVDFAKEFADNAGGSISWKGKLLYRTALAPALGLADLAFAGFFDELGDDWGCAGCIFVMVVIRELAITGISVACGLITGAFFPPAAPLCGTALPILLDIAATFTPLGDIRNEACDGFVDWIDYC